MVFTFKQLRDIAYRDIFLSTDFFAEQLLVIPDLGYQDDQPVDEFTGRNPYEEAINFATLSGTNFVIGSVSEIEEVDGSLDGGQTYERTENIVVQCCRDPNATTSKGVVLGGIKQPNLHMGLKRMDVTKDQLGIPYMFVRQMDNPSDVLWRLHFSRVIQGVRGLSL